MSSHRTSMTVAPRSDGSAREPMLQQAGQSEEAPEPAAEAPVARPEPRPIGTLALFRYAKRRERLWLSLAFACAVVNGMTQPLLSFFMKDLLQSIFQPNDDGTEPPTIGPHFDRDEKVRASVLIFAGMAVVAFLTTFFSMVSFARIADNLVLRLKLAFFSNLLQKDVGWYDANSASAMATRLTNDTYEMRQGMGEKMASLIQGLSMTPLSYVVALILDWRLALMMTVVLPLIGLGFGTAMKLIAKSATAQQARYSKAGGIAETAIASIRTVAAFGGFQRELDKYDELLQGAEREGKKSGWYTGMSLGSSQFCINAAFALGFFVGSILLVHDYDSGCWKSAPPFGTCFTGSKMLATLFAVLYAGMGFGIAGPNFALLGKARAAAARIYEVIDDPPAFDAEAGQVLEVVHGSIEFQEVSFSYPQRLETKALNSVSFNVAAGQTAAFVGPSGSGKSTIISLLQRFYDPTGGRIFLDSHDIRELRLSWLRLKMALVQQEPVLFSGTIYENVQYGMAGSTAEDVKRATQAANAHDFISSFPAKYETEVGERGVQLSGGQKQRIAIARAIIRDPAILMLDEATSALDSESERVVQAALDKLLCEKVRTTFVVAHRLSTIRNANVIFVLEDGRLLERGTHDELMATEGSLYGQLVQLQAISGTDDQETLLRQISAGSTGSANARKNSGGVSRRTSGGLQRQRSEETGARSPAQQDESASKSVAEVPQEDNETIPVPLSRLWAMQRDSIPMLILALCSTVPVAIGRPISGFLFAHISNLYSQPPAKLDLSTDPPRWVGALDTGELARGAREGCLFFVGLGLLMFLGNTGQIGGFANSAERLTRRLRILTFRAMLRQEMAWFDARHSGHLVDRLASEAPLIRSFTGESLGSVVQMTLTVGMGIGLALWFSWKLTIACVAFVPLMSAGTFMVIKYMKAKNETRAGPMVSEAMSHIRTIAAFGLRPQMEQRYVELLKVELSEELRKSTATAFASSYSGCMQFLLFGGVVLIASVFINQAWILPSDVLQVLFPIMFCASGAAIAAQWRGDREKGQVAINHIFHTLDRLPAIDAYDTGGDRPGKVDGEIEFSHVVFRYPMRPDVVVFEDLCLVIKPNTSVALVGPSGSGKSTVISLLQRFYDPLNGSVLFDGRDLRQLNISWLRAKMAFVQQEPVLFSGTILENIAYGREGATQQQCEEAARAANAYGFVTSFPNGFATDVGERGAQLSGGQKQRIAVARAMVRDPAVLLLDEATSALDTESERVVQEALDELLEQASRTTIIVAHRLSTIVNCDMICVIYNGRIVEQGKHAELMNIPEGQYRQLVARQQEQ